MDAGEYAQADSAYALAIELDPENPSCRLRRVASLRALGATEQALTEIQALVDASPYDVGLQNSKIGVLCDAARYNEAELVYRHIIREIEPLDIAVVLSLAELQIVMGRPDSSLVTMNDIDATALPADKAVVLRYLQMVAGEYSGKDIASFRKHWEYLLTCKPSLDWWSFIFFEKWLETAALTETQKSDFHAWTEATKHPVPDRVQ
jgi:tetratricopeptide (TPR) repeat protein